MYNDNYNDVYDNNDNNINNNNNNLNWVFLMLDDDWSD